MITSIQEDTVQNAVCMSMLEQKIEREQVAKVTGTNKDDSSARKGSVAAERDQGLPERSRAHAEAARNTNSAAAEKQLMFNFV